MHKSGFSIVELMVTIAVAGILTALAMPSFSNAVKANQIASQSNDFIGAISLARSEAAKRGQIVVISGASSPAANEFGNGWTIWTDKNSNNQMDSGEEIRTQATLKGANTLDSVDNIDAIRFAPTGFPFIPAGVSALKFRLCASQGGVGGREITIKSTGRVASTPCTAGCACP
jgi:type IV fimbrial biogenesis protein FimT